MHSYESFFVSLRRFSATAPGDSAPAETAPCDIAVKPGLYSVDNPFFFKTDFAVTCPWSLCVSANWIPAAIMSAVGTLIDIFANKTITFITKKTFAVICRIRRWYHETLVTLHCHLWQNSIYVSLRTLVIRTNSINTISMIIAFMSLSGTLIDVNALNCTITFESIFTIALIATGSISTFTEKRFQVDVLFYLI